MSEAVSLTGKNWMVGITRNHKVGNLVPGEVKPFGLAKNQMNIYHPAGNQKGVGVIEVEKVVERPVRVDTKEDAS